MKRLFTFLCAIFLTNEAHPMENPTLRGDFDDSLSGSLVRAACAGDRAAIRSAIEGGALLNGDDGAEFTPLISVLRCRNLDGLSALLEIGADPNKPALDGANPAWVSSLIPDKRYIETLMLHGVDLNGDTKNRNTSALLGSITIGFQEGYWHNFHAVLEGDVDLNAKYGPNPGITAAEKAIGLGLFSVALDLVNRGYHLDLDGLLRTAERRPVDKDSKEYSEKAALLERLREHR